ncbi:T9SS type A sorting domain-containing protein [Flavobacterium silvisoli]|uniref:T9SS type A sorting domain-containing protein n=1 Tax=Flavobacterium silvisoli TaxID=2529433 RepID=A0A4Q9YZB3_9FLAO|nr:T9SS type A sorting domain-containing protein [Flavobacterium silvisoli]TBX69207.1 T9SS type A sorting domain-containing protein [Flavobacterium silvisoli]
MKKALLKLGLVVMFCFVANVNAQTAGTLTFTYNQPQPTSPSLNQGVKNVYAVWIENAAGTFIKTKCRYTSTSTDDHLPTWASKSGCANTTIATGSACNVTDASTGATRTTSTTPTAFGTKTITWDGKNVVGTTNGTTVVDGTYKIWVESSWNDGANNIHNELIGFTFTKGPTEQTLTPAGDTYINTVTLHWLPDSMGVQENSSPVVSIYPVPSTGIFNIDMKNEVKNIRVYDLLGKTVYSEEVNPNAIANTIQVNLSNLTDGTYIISLQNDNGISNFEVIVNK